MTNEIRDPSPFCPTCGRYLTVLGCTADRCAGPPEEAEAGTARASRGPAVEADETGRKWLVTSTKTEKGTTVRASAMAYVGSSVWESRGRWWDELIDKLENIRRCDGRLPNEHLCQLVRGHDGPHLHDCVRGRCDADGQERA